MCDQDTSFSSSLMEAFAEKLNIRMIMVSTTNHKSLLAEHGIKSLSNLLVKHLSGLWSWYNCLPYAMLCYNSYSTPNLDNYSPYELVFCDCQLDLEHHATILRQLSSCTDNRTAHFRVEFVVNLGFYQLLRNRRPKLVENVCPNVRGQTQIFNVRLAPADQTPLGVPTDLKDALECIGWHGRLRPIVENPHTRPTPRISSTHGSCTVHCSHCPFSELVSPRRTVFPLPF